MSENFQKTTFPSGLRVLTERHENVPSATIGVWIEAVQADCPRTAVISARNNNGSAALLIHSWRRFVPGARRHHSYLYVNMAWDGVGRGLVKQVPRLHGEGDAPAFPSFGGTA